MGLNKKEMASYGIGAVGKDMVYMFCASYILYYYQDILGVSAIAMGIILLAARVFDAFNDPIMGVVVAKTRTRWGKFRPWLFIGTLLNAVVLFLMFSAPPTLDGGGLVAYAAVTYVLWGVTYTMMDIPYWSMIPAFTEGGKERENMSTMARSCAAQHSIKKDKDEAMYGLESFDNRINSIGDNIKKTEEEKQNALREFEETVKPDLVKEVEGRYLDKLNLMREELAKKKDEYMKLDDLIKQQRIYISSNYEAYLGKEFVNVQRLTELDNIISSGEAQTISQAMAVYKNRK